MGNVNLIRTEDDYKAALARAEQLMDAEAGTARGDELEHLAKMIEAYEEKHHPIELLDSIAAIQFRMEQEDLSNKDLIPYIGSSAKVSEVLSGKRELTLSMIRALHKHLGIPAEGLIEEPGGTIPNDVEGLDWNRFPVLEMVERGFVKAQKNAKENAERPLRDLMTRAGGLEVAAPLCRKSDGARRNAKMDSCALACRCLPKPRRRSRRRPIAKGLLRTLLREVVKLSAFDDGLKRAKNFLAEYGILARRYHGGR
jgi:HTH-type transcriptional regulator / antitoxin HigA